MENKLNIAELLKDCPKGTKLYSPLVGECTFEHIHGELKKILISASDGTTLTFNNNGTYFQIGNSECLLFPSKDQRDWSKFQRPFKDGDIVATDIGMWIGIVKKPSGGDTYEVYVGINTYCTNSLKYGSLSFSRPATEEEKQKLFKAIKDNGYHWDPETKTLEKLPKFKVGNKIKYINGKNKDGVKEGIILSITNDTYDVAVTNDMGIFVPISEQDNWELVPYKFDVTTLKPFDKVLVRLNSLDCWHIQYFEKYDKGEQKYHFICLCECKYEQCIPYEENKHLLNTSNNCNNYYKTWE